ncbi:3-deoxy-8-phosphooctulonate synthase [Candidatus Dependentiae bacterium]|nr:3-deoxy-8-phosphooctulonate synthase [Candidatus Dependentiae bacterium]
MKKIKVGNIEFSNKSRIVLIAGPCVIESEKIVLKTAHFLKKLTEQLHISFVFKSSFDKANRSSISSFRGPGLEKGLKILEKVKVETGLSLLVDVHKEEEVPAAAEVADIIQIPAFLCRQTDLIIAAAKSKKCVNIKKGQFLAPWDIKNTIKKIESQNNGNILLTERGVCFGYNRWIVDMCSLYEMSKTGYPVIFDVTHSVQIPGGEGTHSGGIKEYIDVLARSATAVGIAGLFLETHPNPEKALSDGKNMLPLNKIKSLLTKIIEIDSVIKN